MAALDVNPDAFFQFLERSFFGLPVLEQRVMNIIERGSD